ncbi:MULTISPECIES: hypothetical protein [Bacillaceae]|uniref:Uncharacterized protein n=1 Tax=Evansella alkalicola TaxID=745819 RepID=A0ABS6JRB1_9BACI|nr:MULTISPECIES: hypothetical protein [Bacillaceae]MBU9720631.1 hypothetical protein [Bacillus alkalicola]
MIDKRIKLVLIILTFMFLFPIHNGFADNTERITITTEIGFNNTVKRFEGFPITVTLKNNGGDISGDLAIVVNPSNNSNNANFLTEVHLPANSEQTIQLTVPGHSGFFNNNRDDHILFYEGGWKNGNRVKMDGDTRINPAFINQEDVLVGLLTPFPDEYQFIRSLRSSHGFSITSVPIENNEMPKDPIGLNMFEYIIIDQFSVAEHLSNDQQNAIKSWISSGGTLIVAPDIGLEQKIGSLEELMPIESFSREEKYSGDFFHSEEEISNIELSIGTMKDKSRVMQSTDDGIPVVVSNTYGSGEVIQLAYSPSSSAFTDWEGANEYWLNTFRSTTQNRMYQQSIYDSLSWGLAQTTNLFPSSFLPFSILVLIFAIYVIIMIPAIYLVLRKLDKREYSWWLLPAVSLVISLSIFWFGGKDRIANPQINEMTAIKVDEAGYGQGYGSIALLSNRSGDYEINVEAEGFSAFPIEQYYGGYNQSTEATAAFRNQGDQVNLLYKDVEYWSIRNATGPIYNLEIGELQTDLKLEDNEITGTITNTSKIDFEDLLFMSGRQEYSLGELSSGETKNVSFELKASILSTPTVSRHYHYNYNQNLEERRKEELFSTISEFNLFDRGKPALIGLTRNTVLGTSIVDSNALMNNFNAIVYSVNIEETSSGPFTLETDDLTPEFHVLESQSHFLESNLDSGGREVYAGEGIYEFIYYLPDDLFGEKVEYNEFQVTIHQGESFNYEIYNVQTEQYDMITDSNIFMENNGEMYVSSNGEMIIKVEKSEFPEQIPVPEVSLKGEVKE